MFRRQTPKWIDASTRTFQRTRSTNDLEFSSDNHIYIYSFRRTSDYHSICLVINIPPEADKEFYYEAKMKGSKNSLAVGVVQYITIHQSPLNGNLFDWSFLTLRGRPNKLGPVYHGDTGKVWRDDIVNGTMVTVCGEPITISDVIGCGFDVGHGRIFFTLNGKN